MSTGNIDSVMIDLLNSTFFKGTKAVKTSLVAEEISKRLKECGETVSPKVVAKHLRDKSTIVGHRLLWVMLKGRAGGIMSLSPMPIGMVPAFREFKADVKKLLHDSVCRVNKPGATCESMMRLNNMKDSDSQQPSPSMIPLHHQR